MKPLSCFSVGLCTVYESKEMKRFIHPVTHRYLLSFDAKERRKTKTVSLVQLIKRASVLSDYRKVHHEVPLCTSHYFAHTTCKAVGHLGLPMVESE
jgi:hypothetical protein